MGKRGPKKQPTRLRLLRAGVLSGTDRPNEPVPPPGDIVPPDYVVGRAREKWDDIVPKLKAMGLMTTADIETFARYCVVWEQWAKCLEQIRRGLDVLVMKDADGKVRYMQVSPAATMFSKHGQTLLRIEQEFGLTPSARASMEVPIGKEDPDDAILRKYTSPRSRGG